MRALAPPLPQSGAAGLPLWKTLGPLCTMVFAELLAMGLPLPVLPVHVRQALGLGAFAVGVAVGALLSLAVALVVASRSNGGTR